MIGFGFYQRNPNTPEKVRDPRPEPRTLDGATGNPARDGYERLSRADRYTGNRPSVDDAAMNPPPGPRLSYEE